MSTIEVKVPDIGDFKDVPVIEVFVKPGDVVKAEESLVTLESDKATMDVPAPVAGTVAQLKVKVGDKVSEGSPILTLEATGARAASAPPAAAAPDRPLAATAQATAPSAPATPTPAAPPGSASIPVKVPDIGDFKDVPVIEILVRPGDRVKPEDALVTLESDKATMDVPAPAAGVVREVKVKVGDKVSEGSVILLLDAAGAVAAAGGGGAKADRQAAAP